MGGVSVLCLLFVLSMCLHVQKMRLKYKRAMRSIEEGNADDEEDNEDEGRFSPRHGQEAREEIDFIINSFTLILYN